MQRYTLRPRQREAINIIRSDGYKSLLVMLPTGYGKTVIGIEAMLLAIERGERCAYISPLKALTGEQVETFNAIGLETCEITRDTGQSIDYTVKSLSQYNVFVFTFEKLESIMLSPKRRNLFFKELNVKTLVNDEIHNVADKGRGANLAFLILSIKHVVPDLHIIGLSATIGNPERFAEWLDADLVKATVEERPVPLKVDIETYNEFTATETNERMETVMQYIDRYPDSKFIIFVATRHKTVNIARKIAMKFNYRLAMKANSVITYSFDEKETEKKQMEQINTLIKCGACYHNAGLSRNVKKHIEKEFRENPNFRVIVATTTLAQGVNMPGDVCVMFETTRYNFLRAENVRYEANEIHQMIGRAGRPGMSKFGLALIFCEPQDEEWMNEIIKQPIDVHCQIVHDLKRKILEALTAFVMNMKKLTSFFGGTLDPIDDVQFKEAFDWLEKNDFLSTDSSGGVKINGIGRKTAWSFVQPETTLQLLEVCKEIEEKNIKFDSARQYYWLFDQMFLTNEFLEQIAVRKNAKNDRNCIMYAMQYNAFTDERIAKAFAILFVKQIYADNGLEDKDNEIKFSNGDKKTLLDVTDRFFLAAGLLFDSKPKIAKAFNTLKQMVHSSFSDMDLAELFSVKRIGGKRFAKLVAAGIKSIDQFIDLSPQKIQSITGAYPPEISQMLDSAQDIIEGKPVAKAKESYLE